MSSTPPTGSNIVSPLPWSPRNSLVGSPFHNSDIGKIKRQIKGYIEANLTKPLMSLLRKHENKDLLHYAACYAAKSGKTKTLKEIIQNGDLDINTLREGKNPLHYAVIHGHRECVEELLSSDKVNIEARSQSGKTALCYAVQNGHLDLVEMLIDKKADVNNRDYVPPLSVLIAAKGKKIVADLRKIQRRHDSNQRNNITCITVEDLVAKQGDVKILRALKQAGVDVNALDRNGKTGLQNAVCDEDSKAVALWLALGADVNESTAHGHTALHMAACRNKPEFIDWFVEHRVDVDAQDSEGNTALHLAAFKENDAILKALFKAGACGKIRNHQDISAIDILIQYAEIQDKSWMRL